MRSTRSIAPNPGADYWTVSALPHDQLQDVLRRRGMLMEKGAQ
jgi:hypothetical protein